MFVGEKTFTSVYTPDVNPTNSLTFTVDPNYDYVVCPANNIPILQFELAEPMTSSYSVSYTFYEDFGTDDNTGGVVMTFKSAHKTSPKDIFEIQVLTPFATFVSKENASCTVNPPLSDFNFNLQEEEFVYALGSFEANQEYVVTCPHTKVILPYGKTNYTLATGGYYNYKTEEYYQNNLKNITFNAASFTTFIVAIVVALSALAALL